MGTGKAKSKGNVAKKRGGKKSSEGASEKKILKEHLSSSGPFVLREFCQHHGMDNDEAMKKPKDKLISFLMGKFDEGELTFNDLFPDEGNPGKKGKTKKDPKKGNKKNASKSKAKEEWDDEDDDNAGDDDLDDDEIELELDDDDAGDVEDDDDGDVEDDDDAGDDDDDLSDDDDLGDDDDDVDLDVDDDDDEDGADRSDVDVSILEDKIDKLMDINTKTAKSLDLMIQVQLQTMEILRQGLKVIFKLLKVKNPKKLLGQIDKAGAKAAGIEDLEDE
jgi:hypothetical protein